MATTGGIAKHTLQGGKLAITEAGAQFWRELSEKLLQKGVLDALSAMVRLQIRFATVGVVTLSRPARIRPIIIEPNMINKVIAVTTGENSRKPAVYRGYSDDPHTRNLGVVPV